jgi:beta-glucosidase
LGQGLPPGFRFGVATAAYQIEGAVHEDGRGESIWDRFSHTPGKVAGGHTGDVACDHYHRWREDLDLMAGLGVEAYRFSIAWPRVLPRGDGEANPAGIRFYRELAEGLRERGIEPIATLYHWDLPQALQDRGGWAERDTARLFAEYAALMQAELGDVVSEWITINEPWVVAFLGHAWGDKAPGMRDWPTALRVSHHLMLGHGLAVQALEGSAGITLNLAPVRGEPDPVRIWDGHFNRWFLDPVLRGVYPADMLELYERECGWLDWIRDGDLDTIGVPTAFLGVNYYFPARVEWSGAYPLGVDMAQPDPPLTAMGWPVEADGLRELLVRLRDDYGDIPISITENGAAYDDPAPNGGVVEDPERTAYLESHLGAVRAAMEQGVDVRRYCVWSLLDNYEWEHGYDKRFGIVHVDYETQRRTPKQSAHWYRDHIRAVRSA